MDPDLPPAQLTYAAEELGHAHGAQALPELLALLEHESALVREGAIYGIDAIVQREGPVAGVRERLERLAGSDPSPGVRDAARDALALLALVLGS